MTFRLTSPAFDHLGEIPRKYTCDGDDISPPLSWSGVPANARSLVLIVDDPDAPDPAAPKRVWVHWLVYNIPSVTSSLPEHAFEINLPVGVNEGHNDWDRADYGGPCPPIGRHRYFFKLYALDVETLALKTPNKAKLEAAMKPHIIATTELIGTYQR